MFFVLDPIERVGNFSFFFSLRVTIYKNIHKIFKYLVNVLQ